MTIVTKSTTDVVDAGHRHAYIGAMATSEPVERLRAWVDDEAGGNQHEAARLIGVHPSYVCRVLSGERRPSRYSRPAHLIQRATRRWSGGAIRVSEWGEL